MKDFYIPKGGGPFVEMGNHRAYVKVQSTETVGGFSLSHVHADTGGGVPPHIHRREDEAFYILEGRFQFRVGEKTFEVGPDDTILGPRDVVHAWQCVSPEGGRLSIFFTPGDNMEAFGFSFARLVASGETVEPAMMAALAAEYGIEMLPHH